MSKAGFWLCLCALSCASRAHECPTCRAHGSASMAVRADLPRVASGASVPGPSSAAPAPALTPAPTPAPTTASEALAVKLERVLTAPVTALALGEGSRIAVLADQPWLGDARGFSLKPLPRGLQAGAGQHDTLDVFYGRDNEPRILGTRRDDAGTKPIYWRHVASGWRDGREEIARLGEPGSGGLWGLLGAADPELVCRVNAQCIVKRRSGWKTMPAGPVARLVTLHNGVLWSLDDEGLKRLGAADWELGIAAAAAPAWRATRRAFWVTDAEAWVSTARELLHFRDGQWRSFASPVGEVVSFWGTGPDSLWLAGTNGGAHFDGVSFRKLTLAGPLHVVRGRSDQEVWFGGDAGLFRVTSSAGG